MAVAARDAQGHNVDFAPDSDVTISPHSTYTYSKTQAFMGIGTYTFSIANYQDGLGWNATYPASISPAIARSVTANVQPNPTITTGLSLSPAGPSVGQNVTASFVVSNNGDVAINVGTLAVAVRDPQGQNADFAPDTNVTIPAHGTYTYSKTQAFMTSGNYSFSIANNHPSLGWNAGYPASSSSSIVRSLTTAIKPNPRIITSLSLSPANPSVGQTVTASFQIRNFGDSSVDIGTMAVTARDPQGHNVDFAPDTNVTIPANSTYTYSQTRTFTTAGTHTLSIGNFRTGIGWNAGYPVADSPSILTLLSVMVAN